MKSGSETLTVTTARRRFHFTAAQHEADATTHITAETLTRQGVVSLLDLPRVAPNLTVQSVNGTGTTNFFLRGIGLNDYTQNNMSSVLVYYDDVAYPLARMASGMMFDIAGAAVEPGPVGFAHGQADTGGEVAFHTNDPTDDWHGGVSQDIASYARSRTNLFVSGPIVTDKLSFRIAGQTMQGGGWQTNPSNGAHLGDANLGALRAKLRWRPEEHTEIMLSGHWVQDDSEVVAAKPVVNFLPTRPYPTLTYQQAQWDYNTRLARLIGRPTNLKPSEHNTMWGADLKASHDFGFATLRSISAFETERVGEYTDQDGTLWATGDNYRNIVANSFSQELRLESRKNRPLDWVIGAYYDRVRMTQQSFFDFTDYVPTRGYLQETSFGQNQQTFSQFAHLAYKLPHRLTLIGGLTHEADDRQLLNLRTVQFGRRSLQFQSTGSNMNQFAGTLGLQFQATKDLMTYFKVSRGMKPGGMTANNTVVQGQLDPFKPETVLAYELGFKADLIPNRFRLNAAAFYYDYHDQQYLGTYVVPSYGPLGRFDNIPKSEIWGTEFNTEINPIRHVYLTQNFGYLRSKYQRFQAINAAAVNAQYARTGIWAPIYTDYAGTEGMNPKLTLNGSGDYRIAFLKRYEGEAGIDWNFRSAQSMVPGGTGPYQLPAYFLLGAHLTVHPLKGPWTATLYASNILNREYFTTSSQSTTTYFRIPGPPRFIGGRIGLTY
ncbi:TonB-dependent receptor [Asaia sp. W19]|uniref:TonB-dependent receptor n=1 Tax=Asaia sp. W19 TaxID=2067395 RepID=UPI000F8CC7B5|nr:TonB-dependent receptor [Asaia sp. W19]RUT26506.1 TonB-dependent receptor [Asaia sp. W19]